MFTHRLVAPLFLATTLVAACAPRTASGPADTLVDSVAQSVSDCKAAVRSLRGAMENSMDPNAVAAARDTCNGASAAIAELSVPAELPAEQAELFATSLHDCAQAQSNIAELMGMAISRRSNITAEDQSRLRRVAGQERSKACIKGLEQALASGGGKLSAANRFRLSDSMPGFF